MKVLVKLGGTLLDDASKLDTMARQLSEAKSLAQLVVVHGGGKQVTRYLEERGVTSRFVGGLRVTDAVVIDAVTKVIAGSINTQLVSALAAAGQLALGLSGVDGALTRAEQLNPELELVGRPTHSNGPLLQLLVDAGYLPVVACLAGDERGRVFNVNADQMAVSCAIGWGAERLIFLTDVDGVKDGAAQVLRSMTPGGVADLIASGVAYGGMQAKLEAATTALRAGLRVTIASGSEPAVASRLLRGEALGTELMPA